MLAISGLWEAIRVIPVTDRPPHLPQVSLSCDLRDHVSLAAQKAVPIAFVVVVVDYCHHYAVRVTRPRGTSPSVALGLVDISVAEFKVTPSRLEPA
jgi:hypothetical protein